MVTVWVTERGRVVARFQCRQFNLDDLIRTVDRYWLLCHGFVCVMAS
jgi:hypothetical protein